MKRQKTFFALIVLVLIVAACGGDDGGEDFEAPVRPVIVIRNGDETVGGQLLNICWPRGTNNVSCEPSFAEGDPIDALTIERSDTITISVSESAPPDEILIESREIGPGGDPLISLTLQGGNDIELVASELSDGRNILDITAFYYDLAESQAVVTNAFAVDVGTVVAVDVTPEVTDETEEPTDEPTVDVTETPTPTLAPTDTPEPEDTEEPTEVAVVSPEATRDVEIATDATVESDETEEPKETPTQERPTRAATTAAPDEDATEEPTVRPTNTPTVAPTTSLPTLTPSPVPTTIVPTPTIEIISPTATSVSVITPTASEDDVTAVVGTAPTVTVRVGSRSFSAIGLEYCRRGTNNEQICIERAIDSDSTVNRMVRVGRGRAAQFRIGNGRPESVEYEVINLRTRDVLESSERDGDNIILFSVNQPAGNYILSVVVDWGETVGTYYFQLQVQE
jgi:hypothetical protein